MYNVNCMHKSYAVSFLRPYHASDANSHIEKLKVDWDVMLICLGECNLSIKLLSDKNNLLNYANNISTYQ